MPRCSRRSNPNPNPNRSRSPEHNLNHNHNQSPNPNQVLEVSPCDEGKPRELHVHFIGWKSRFDEWVRVATGRLRPPEPPREAPSPWFGPSVKLKLGPPISGPATELVKRPVGETSQISLISPSSPTESPSEPPKDARGSAASFPPDDDDDDGQGAFYPRPRGYWLNTAPPRCGRRQQHPIARLAAQPKSRRSRCAARVRTPSTRRRLHA